MSVKILKNRWSFFAAPLLAFMLSAQGAGTLSTIAATDLPHEAQVTLKLVQEGKPMPYAKDGVLFGNYEGVLPKQKRGYYHEFTVPTPGIRSRGARRLIAGGERGRWREYYYTADHYASFKRIQD